ncbi:unnamed protein product [Trichogramma brassicae]|uniref:Uncharacterized protein n=1 Tax=Trichogramma brassicae TaxID=86971 RepID=A0A6H5I497_9HYME|nr:unnamed protein product [Trichogramma brassicae]
MALGSEFQRRCPTQEEMPAMCDHAADGSEKGDTTIDDGIVQDRRDATLQPYYIRLDWLLPSQRRCYFLNIETFEVLNGLCPEYISNFYCWTGDEVRRSARIEGGTPTIEVPFADSSTFKSGFSIRAANSWNALPAQLRSSGSLAPFKSLLGHCLRRHQNAQ